MRIGNLASRAVILTEDGAIDICTASDGRFGPSLRSVYDNWDAMVEWSQSGGGVAHSFDAALLGSPSPEPRQVFGIGLGNAIRAAAGRVIESGKILGGVAILENAYHETARIEAVALDDFFAHEERLLIEAKRLMGRLPLDEIDVLVCDRMGKNISGAGIDTNIIGRSVYGYEQGRPWREGMPVIHRIVVRDLAEESDGNAVGMGMVDFVPRRFASKVNEEVTVLNATTAQSPENAKWPIVLQNDRDCLRMALATSPDRVGGPLVVYIRDTLELGSAFVSEACVPLLRDRADIEIARPFVFMRWSADDLVSPFLA